MDLAETIKKIRQREKELEEIFVSSAADRQEVQKYSQEYSRIKKIVPAIENYERILKEIRECGQVLKEKDEQIREIAREERQNLEKEKQGLEKDIGDFFSSPCLDSPERNVFIEIRAGTGGEEAGLFVGDLFRMYSRYIERKKWKMEVISSHPISRGGFKEIIFKVEGNDVYAKFLAENGVHRVQRVPITEASGRVHTSAVSVAVLPEAREIEVEIRPEDLRIDTFGASGPGGQHMQKSSTAVRLTHVPSGIIVSCQDERSQLRNKQKALEVLRARIFQQAKREEEDKISQERKGQIGTGQRSEKIRTYNFAQNRVSDHRRNITIYRLEEILDGNLDLLEK